MKSNTRWGHSIWKSLVFIVTPFFFVACQSLYHLDGIGDKSPFENIRWTKHDALHVKLQGRWYQLLEIEGVGLEEIKQVSKDTYGFYWKKRIIGDTTAVISLFGKYNFFDVELTLKDLQDNQVVKLHSTLDKKQILLNHLRQARQVSRPHSTLSDPRFAHLTTRLYGFPTSEELENQDVWLSAKQSKEDLDTLETNLVNHFAYLKLRHVDYQNALDTIRNSLGAGIHKGDFGLQVRKFLALFGDGHTTLSYRFLQKNIDIPRVSLPFDLKEIGGKVVALSSTRKFYHSDFPFLKSIDGLSVQKLQQQTGFYRAKGSKGLRKSVTRWIPPFLQITRREQGIVQDQIQVVFTNAKKEEKTTIFDKNNDLSDNLSGNHSEDSISYQVMSQNIGYLKMSKMGKSNEFLEKLDEAMSSFQSTKGLIIDVRDNGGGSRQPTLKLLAYFLNQPQVINIAALRIDADKDPNVNESYGLQSRFLHPRKSKIWKIDERQAIDEWLATHALKWDLPKGEFSKLHLTVVSPNVDKRYDAPLVILMNERNFSATDIFLGAFKGLPCVKLIGVASSGGSGFANVFKLPNSGYVFKASRIASFQKTGELYEGQGVLPDIWIDDTIESIQQGQDIQLQKALEFLTAKHCCDSTLCQKRLESAHQ